jgi:hypothetical protein
MPTEDNDLFDTVNNWPDLIAGKTDSDSLEAKFLQLIAHRVAELMDQDMGLLMSYMYRLDIDEEKIQHVLHGQRAVAPHWGLAELILERQKQRIRSKSQYRQKDIEGWDNW